MSKQQVTTKSLLIFTLVTLFLFYEMGVQVSPSVMTHSLMSALHLSAVGLGFMSGFYFYTYTAMQIPAGILLDRFGVRRVVATALLVCALGCLFFGSAHSIVGGSFARLFTGFGSAFAFVSVLAVAERWFPSKHFAVLAGIAQLFAALGAMGGQLPLSFVTHHIGWRNTFFMLALASLILAALIGSFVRDRPKVCKAMHYCDKGVKFRLGVLFKNPQTWFLGFYAFLNWAPMAAFASLWGVPFLQANYGMSLTVAATYSSLVWIGIGLGSPLVGWLSDCFKKRNTMLRLTTLLGLLVSLALLFIHQLPLLMLGVLLFLLGVSCAGQVLSFAVVKENAAEDSKATAIAINNMAVVASGALVQPLVGVLLKLHASTLGHFVHYSAKDYQFALMVLPLVYAVGLILALFFIKETNCQKSKCYFPAR